MRRCSPAFSRSDTSPRAALLTAAVVAALTAPVEAQLQFDELPRMGLPVVNDGTISVVLGDVDGDGDLDMVIGNRLHQNRLYPNLQRQLHAPVIQAAVRSPRAPLSHDPTRKHTAPHSDPAAAMSRVFAR